MFWKNHPEYSIRNIAIERDWVSQLLIYAIESNLFVNGGSLIEIGSGPGTRSIPIAKEKDLKLTLLDLSQSALELARERAKIYEIPIKLELQDMLNTGLSDNSFDIVYGYGPHDHFFWNDRQLIFDEMYRITKPWGIVVSILPSKLNPFWFLEKLIKQINGTWEFWPTEFFTPRELLKRTRKAGYRELKLLWASFYTSWLRILPRQFVNKYKMFDYPTGIQKVDQWLHIMNMKFENPLNKYFGWEIMVVGKKLNK